MRVDTRLKFEDVSMGIWLSKKPGGVNIVHNKLFRYFGCSDVGISAHYMSSADMVCNYYKDHCCSPEETNRFAISALGTELLKEEEWQNSTKWKK